MALIEKALADDLVDLRLAISLGHDYVPAADLERALQRHLEDAQRNRAIIAETAAVVGYQARTDGA